MAPSTYLGIPLRKRWEESIPDVHYGMNDRKYPVWIDEAATSIAAATALMAAFALSLLMAVSSKKRGA